MEIITATLYCPYCRKIEVIGKKKTARSFMIQFNRFKRRHDEKCKINASVEKTKRDTEDAIKRIMGKV